VSIVWRTTAASSSCVIVEYSPVVPSVRMALVPPAIWRSMRWVRASKFTLPSSWNGVIMATMEPRTFSNFIGVVPQKQGHEKPSTEALLPTVWRGKQDPRRF